jgi:uncharacterized protein (TIGR02099 family)
MPWRHGLQLALQATVVLGLAALCLSILAWLTLQWGILPHIEDWRPAIERHASRAIGVPVRIGHISVRSSGWIPAVEMSDVVLYDPAGPEALRLPRVSAALSPRSFVVMAPRLAQLYVEGARLVVRRDAQGGLHVAGIGLAGENAPGTPVENTGALDWFFSQQEFVLRHATVRWVDEMRHAPALALTDVDVVARNGLRGHAMRLDATPPPEWGDRFSARLIARQPLFAPAGDWRRWSGTFYADLPRGDVSHLAAHVSLPFQLDGGEGALRLWLDFQTNGWRGALAEVALSGVHMRLAPALEPLAITKAAGRFSATRTTAGVSFQADRFGFTTADGVDWPAGRLRVSWTQRQTLLKPAQALPVDEVASRSTALPSSGAPTVMWDTDQPVTGGLVQADALDLALMRRLAGALPLPAGARQWLADYQPAGVVKGLSLKWDGPPDAPAHYRAGASVDAFSIAAGAVPAGLDPGRPGWRDAKLRFDATEAGGTAHLDLDGGALEFPNLFEESMLPFSRFAADASWTIAPPRAGGEPPAISVALRNVRFANADAEGQLQADWHTGPGSRADLAPGARFPGQLDMAGELTRATASRIWRYFPIGIPQDTRRYLRAAFASGEASSVKFALRGDLADFPFDHGRQGEFRVAASVSGVDLTYAPGVPARDAPLGTVVATAMRESSPWPAFTDVRGDVLLDHGALEIRNASGRMSGIQLQDVHGAIRPLYEQQVLELQGRASGPMPDFLRYVDQSPVHDLLDHALDAATSNGSADLDLSLTIPLAHANDTTLAGSLNLPGNDVRIVPDLPMLAGTRARVDFTQRSVTVSNASARALGGELTFDGGSQPDGSLRFSAQGVATADGLRRAVETPAFVRLASKLSGQAPYRLQLGVVKGQSEFTITSGLSGLGVALPAPLNKPSEAVWPLRIATTLSADGQGKPRDTLRVELGPGPLPLLQAEVLRDLSGPVAIPLRAAYAIGAPMPAPQAGGAALVHAQSLDGDAWWNVWKSLDEGSPPAPSPAPVPAGNGAAANTAGPNYWPKDATLRASDLLLGGQRLTNVDMQLTQSSPGSDETWRAVVASTQTHGVVEYKPDTPSRNAQLFARLDRLVLDSDESENAGASTPPPTSSKAANVPALDIVVDDFQLSGKKLGKLEVSASSQAGGRDWRLTRLAMTVPEARFTGTGQWSGAPRRQMSLDFNLELDDSGEFLQRMGMGRVLKGGKGTLAGQVTWTGSPLSLDVPSLGGHLQVALDKGQFLKAGAGGAGRLLGVLSLQSLPRRLTLDFRDLFQEGFAFDDVKGDAKIDRGVATTNDLRMRGLNAGVLMEGSADLKAETQDLRVVVVPEINAGAASLAYAAINPVIGLSTFLAQLLIRHPLAQASTREFHVTGSWADPKVEAIERKTGSEAAQGGAGAASTPASASSLPDLSTGAMATGQPGDVLPPLAAPPATGAPSAPAARPSAPDSGMVSPATR